MQISSHLHALNQVAEVEPRSTAPARNSVATGSGQQVSDTTELHYAAALSGSDVRIGTVEALRAQLANGTYQVSAGDVADKLLAELTGTL